MATLQAPAGSSNGFEINEVAPSGDYIATCLEINDEFGVTRQKYQSDETEQVDVTRFLFGFKAQDGKLYMVQTFEMKISGSPKSTLVKFLTSWLGQPPNMGWDFCEMKGKGAVISVEQVTSQMGKVYNKITRIQPPKTSLADYTAQVIPADQFSIAQAPVAQAPVAPAPALQAPAPQAQASAPQAWDPNSDDNCPF